MESFVQLYMLLAIFCLLLFKSFNEIFSNYYLKALIALLIFISGIKMLTAAGVIGYSPLIFLSGNTALFLFMPAVYLYLRNQVYKKKISKQDWPHALPAIIYCLGCLLVYLFDNGIGLPQADIFFEATGSHRSSMLYFIMFGYGVTGWYLIQVLMILKERYAFPKKNEFVAATPMFSAKEQAEPSRSVELHNGSMYLNEDRILKMDITIKDFLEKQQPFLKHGYSLKQLAEDTRVPVHLLSAFINKHYKVNFNDFINEYRVNYCKVKILNDEWKYKKLEAIADESGFSNRNTFTAAFKRVTGLNPSEFLKTIKDQQAA
jgi:AraC-like DNA-binding protein